MSIPSTYKPPAAAHIANISRDARLAWDALSPAQQLALRRCHDLTWPRIRVDTNVRTALALRELTLVEDDTRDLTLDGIKVREAGTRTPKDPSP